jgi:hypothetical protein
MKHADFSRIAEEEVAFARQADGVDYVVITDPAEGGMRARITIRALHPKSGESIALFRTPKEAEELPALVGLTDAGARDLLQDALSIARAVHRVERYLAFPELERDDLRA